MSDLFVVGLAGFLASLVDGALGMGFGPTSTTILLSNGISPVERVGHREPGQGGHRAGGGCVPLALPEHRPSAGAAAGHPGRRRRAARHVGPRARRRRRRASLPGGAAPRRRHPHPVPLQPAAAHRSGRRRRRRRPRCPASVQRAGVEVAATAGGVTNGLVGAWGPVVTPFLLHRGLRPASRSAR